MYGSEGVKYVDIDSYYHYVLYTSRYQVLCHSCERETLMIGVFSTVTMAPRAMAWVD